MKRQFFLKSISGLGLLTLIPQNAFAKSWSKFAGDSKPKIIRNNMGNLLNVIGDIQTHKLIGSDTNHQIVEWVDNVEPGVGIPPHTHTKEDEIFRVIKGKIEIMVDGKTTTLEAGDMAYAPKDIPHSWKVVGTEKAKMITSAFPAGIELMFKKLADLPAGPPDFKKVAEICSEYGITFSA
ncbi:cupin domain-containing protein [uncultured Winogradskyella sp.]|uniref:cupin domain-containing protein n=1 Tax=uncultured Winogradskyella sp. TaxID=395353 RepID=UPI002602994D|nr:cupin domain-containing protein [uncultured Winogradskyella sp.]